MVVQINKEEFFTPIQARRDRAVFATGMLLFMVFAIRFIIWRRQQLRHLQAIGIINQRFEQRIEERTAQLDVVNKELESFAYTVSHDLRAPLRAMGGFSEALQMEYGAELDDQGRHFLERIAAAVQKMGNLIDNLLALSKGTRVDLLYEQVDLSVMAAEILTELQAAEPERQVVLEIAAGMIVRGDLRLLHVALENLIGNAWKFSSMNCRAKIEVGCDSRN